MIYIALSASLVLPSLQWPSLTPSLNRQWNTPTWCRMYLIYFITTIVPLLYFHAFQCCNFCFKMTQISVGKGWKKEKLSQSFNLNYTKWNLRNVFYRHLAKCFCRRERRDKLIQTSLISAPELFQIMEIWRVTITILLLFTRLEKENIQKIRAKSWIKPKKSPWRSLLGFKIKRITYFNFILCFLILVKTISTSSDFLIFQKFKGKYLVTY